MQPSLSPPHFPQRCWERALQQLGSWIREKLRRRGRSKEEALLPFLMADRLRYSWAFQLLVVMLVSQAHSGCWCYQYKVGDLNSWGVPPASNPRVYALWSQKYHFRLGDSLCKTPFCLSSDPVTSSLCPHFLPLMAVFLYPPSQDSVIQVTERAYNSCSLTDPIKKMSDGNSVFNLTAPGVYYFTSGVPGHCQKLQKLAIAVPSANSTFFPPVDAPPPGTSSALPANSPSYPVVFGPSPPQGSGAVSVGASTAVGSVVCLVLLCLL